MTRMAPIDRKPLLTLVLFAVVALALCSSVNKARAGDSEGVSGYSMRLKNKDFDGSDGGSGSQSGVVTDTYGKSTQLQVIGTSNEAMSTSESRVTFTLERWLSWLITFR